MYPTTTQVPAIVRPADDVVTLRNRLAAALRDRRAAERDTLHFQRQAADTRRMMSLAHWQRRKAAEEPTPVEVLDGKAPWCPVLSPAAGYVTFGALLDDDRTVLAAEDLEQQAMDDAAAEAEWQERCNALDRLYAEASVGYGDPEFRGVLAGHDLD
jgi:hypothetical protein